MSRRVAILGCGKIGESLLAGLLSSDWSDIVVTARRLERVAELQERYGVEATLSNSEAVSGAALVVLAVKPQDFESLLGEIGPSLAPEQTVLSVAAAIPTWAIERRIAPSVPVVRAIHELEQAGVRAAFLNAIKAAMERSRELAGGQD